MVIRAATSADAPALTDIINEITSAYATDRDDHLKNRADCVFTESGFR